MYPTKLDNSLLNAESIVNLWDIHDLGLIAAYFITINVVKKLYKKQPPYPDKPTIKEAKISNK